MPDPVNEVLPVPRLLAFGLQHLFIMYAGAVAVPLIVGPAIGLSPRDIAILVSADLLVSGIATIIQSAGVSKLLGVRLPVVAGATFTVLNPMIIIATQYGGRSGLPYVYGAMLVSGVFGLLLARPFSRVIRFFPPLVTGTTICIIGLSLGGADISLIANKTVDGAYVVSPARMGLAALVLVLILAISRGFRGFTGQIAVLLSIVIGTAVAAGMGLVDFGNVGASGWFGAPSIFHFGAPKFAVAHLPEISIIKRLFSALHVMLVFPITPAPSLKNSILSKKFGVCGGLIGAGGGGGGGGISPGAICAICASYSLLASSFAFLWLLFTGVL
ncbi:MAG: purine/pyrimidine permease [Actinomycetia bacterium]|nr:purine/pyrimidine permease [Actinomycetes bacterium]